jgi:hypothetical protein
MRMRMHTKFWSKNFKGQYYFGHRKHTVKGKIILALNLPSKAQL